MADLELLMRALPVSGMEPQEIARIQGLAVKPPEELVDPGIVLLEPPAGFRVPFVDPLRALVILLRHNGLDITSAATQAAADYVELMSGVSSFERIRFFDYFDANTPECIPIPALIDFASRRMLLPAGGLVFFNRAVIRAINTPVFFRPGHRTKHWALTDLPDLPPAKAMIEFIPCAPWECAYEDDHSEELFATWRERIRPVALNLEKVLGEPVYYFADLDNDYDDDCGHRFLVLNWCCTFKPESAYVKFLIDASRAADIDDLKVALIDAKNYTHPFKMNDAFIGMESGPCVVEYR